MDVLTYTDARKELKGVMDRVIRDSEEIIVTRKNRESVVMVSLDTWNSIQETMHLLSTPNNASRLRASIAQLDAGIGDERDLIE
ncbi:MULTISPECIES: type II toxin-antitoxin system Phd/YefM family antitoxin [unclassified Ruegeria]|uniref:type II toxin-antitoxin system Phd/YefM family antitoxin n=1 Tax=unclassified Ruegeria TaxID=2625375 RepID=UPI0014878C88|nr:MULTISPECIES: type II toxin-antitoxin system prevent-host-death family antitoxin [unclassified Ruegeria]